MTSKAQADTAYLPALVIFGRDDQKKPHASSFSETDVPLATKAAALMGMRLLPVRSDDDRVLAAKVPKGKIFSSGRAFLPFVKADLFVKIEAIAPAMEAAVSLEETLSGHVSREAEVSDTAALAEAAALLTDTAPAVPQPTGWGDIQVGSIVLSAAVPGQMDWFECTVLSLEGKDRYKLRYCDWPAEPAFVHHIAEIGLLHPSRQPEPAIDAEPAPAA